jgi:AraC-like DNA-binding protein/cupin superfamily acireductone dioxygenase involved in methionine salvage
MRQILESFTDRELIFRQYYEKHGNFYYSGTDSQHGINSGIFSKSGREIIRHIKSNETFELTEAIIFHGDEDVSLKKHDRYTFSSEHFHTFFEMIYIYKGQCTNQIDGKEIVMKNGDICIIPPNVIHSIYVNDDSIVINILIRISAFEKAFTSILTSDDLLSKFFGEIVYSNIHMKYLLFHTGSDDILHNTILMMYHNYMLKGGYYNHIINGYLVVFMGFLLRRYENSVEYPQGYIKKNDRIPQIISYIDKNYEHITLEQCSEHFNISARYLASILKKRTEKTFPRLVAEARLKRAQSLLKKYDISIENLSDLLGYSEPSYFMKVFKKLVGCTPTEYRKKQEFV